MGRRGRSIWRRICWNLSRNYGIGGHSVYQAYRRMLIVERDYPAEYVILNVWDDDHFRNLDAWRSIRMGRQGRFTLPHLRVNLESGTVAEREEFVQGRPRNSIGCAMRIGCGRLLAMIRFCMRLWRAEAVRKMRGLWRKVWEENSKNAGSDAEVL